MGLSKTFFITRRYEKLSKLVEGILAVELSSQPTSTPRGRKYSLSHEVTSSESLNLGDIEILRLTELPGRLKRPITEAKG